MATARRTEAVAARRRGLALAVLAGAQLTIALDFSIVYVALPSIGSELGFVSGDLTWVANAYVVTTGGFLLLGGRAADLLGRRRVFVTGACLYAVSSSLGGMTDSGGVLVAVRALQGLGGSLLFPSALALLNGAFEEGPARRRAHAVWGAAGAGGLCFGSLLGGLLVHSFGWQAVFLVNVPLAGVLACAAFVLFPADGPARSPRGGGFDLPGALSGTAGTTLLALALVRGGQIGWVSPTTALTLTAASLAFLLFAVVERRSVDPLLPGDLLRPGGLLPVTALTALYGAAFSAVPYFLTRYFQEVRDLGPLATGAAFLLPALVTAAGTQAAARLTPVLGLRGVLLGGMAAGAVGAGLLGAGIFNEAAYPWLSPGLVLLSLGQGGVWTGMWLASARRARQEDQGAASGVASTALQVGSALGLAALVAVAARGDGGSTGVSPTGLGVAVLAAGVALALGIAALTPVRGARG